MHDDEFLDRFERGDLQEFTHRDHLRVALLYARRGGRDAAIDGARRIRTFAEAHGDHAKYHDTVTVAWARLVAHHAHEAPDVDALVAARPELLDGDILSGYYSPERLWSAEARAGFTEPDVRPLP